MWIVEVIPADDLGPRPCAGGQADAIAYAAYLKCTDTFDRIEAFVIGAQGANPTRYEAKQMGALQYLFRQERAC